eukprot:TRINITY_DN4156_c0_g1_i2.p1 TRINITY_DN4156_c0_g1~~TRINITY_DN4156_c0_g1_i2.p1  ORF type:complete len:316 (+),score=43.29 TRINITY_DN4156_c0_g1_i2:135-1082(+)
MTLLTSYSPVLRNNHLLSSTHTVSDMSLVDDKNSHPMVMEMSQYLINNLQWVTFPPSLTIAEVWFCTLSIVLCVASFRYACTFARWFHPRPTDVDEKIEKLPLISYEWKRRFVGCVIHTFQMLFSLYLMMWDQASFQDVLFGYSPTARYAFLFSFVTYAFDISLLVLHPKRTPRRIIGNVVWSVHHVVAMALLSLLMVCEKGSFVASCFMISSFAHVTNNLRWLERYLNSPRTSRFWYLSLANLVSYFLTAIVPIPYMFYLVSVQTHKDFADIFGTYIPWKCLFGTILIYLPHVILLFAMIFKFTQVGKKKHKHQ